MYYKVRNSLNDEFKKSEYKDTKFTAVVMVLLLILFTIVMLNTFVFFHVMVDGKSMLPTLSSGDVLVANRYKQVKHGSIIIIDGVKKSSDGVHYDLLIKRAIGLGGDTVQIKNGYVYLNGEKLDEPYLSEDQITDGDKLGDKEIKLKEGEVFYLGDNRRISRDGRYYGKCSIDNVIGVVENWSLSLRGINGFMYDIGLLFRGKLKGN